LCLALCTVPERCPCLVGDGRRVLHCWPRKYSSPTPGIYIRKEEKSRRARAAPAKTTSRTLRCYPLESAGVSERATTPGRAALSPYSYCKCSIAPSSLRGGQIHYRCQHEVYPSRCPPWKRMSAVVSISHADMMRKIFKHGSVAAGVRARWGSVSLTKFERCRALYRMQE
jgi:hypothetical protein